MSIVVYGISIYDLRRQTNSREICLGQPPRGGLEPTAEPVGTNPTLREGDLVNLPGTALCIAQGRVHKSKYFFYVADSRARRGLSCPNPPKAPAAPPWESTT